MTHRPVSRRAAWAAIGRCCASSLRMLWRGDLRLPRENVGRVLRFSDGTSAVVYRETIGSRTPADPCFLAVRFRLRGVHGRGHVLFRAESLLNTPLFVGFPGFVSKLWLTHDEHGNYRGLYEWDGSERAESYARSLWRVLELVSAPNSIDYEILPGLRRDDVLAEPGVLDLSEFGVARSDWWRPLAPMDTDRGPHAQASSNEDAE